VLGFGSGMIENFAPVSSIHYHLCGFHMYAHDMTRQVGRRG
jgi:hypothetical protein